MNTGAILWNDLFVIELVLQMQSRPFATKNQVTKLGDNYESFANCWNYTVGYFKNNFIWEITGICEYLIC